MTNQRAIDSDKILTDLKQELVGVVENLDQDAIEYLIRVARREVKWRNDLKTGSLPALGEKPLPEIETHSSAEGTWKS